MGITNWASSSWSSRKFENDIGELNGTIKTKSGGSIPLKMDFVKENGQWKIARCSTPPAGLQGSTAKPSIPSQADLKRLATESLLDFNQAVRTKDFVPFHAKLSAPFKTQKTAQDLRGIFQSFIDSEVDIAGIADLTPVWEPPPAINDDGVLVLTGHYPTTPMRVLFSLKYLDENKVWRLVGIEVNLKRPQ